MKRFAVAALLALACATGAFAQGINNPQTNATNLTAGTLPAGRMPALTGDITTSAGAVATSLATAQSAAHTWAGIQTFTLAPVFTDASGVRTALGLGALATVTPGTGVATALGVAVGSAGAPVLNGGVLGTPSSGVATNLTGTAAGLTAGTVTTNANLTGPITSTGNATAIASQTGTGTTFAMSAGPTFTGSFTATGLVTNAALANMANGTTKCRTTAGTGVPEDCTGAQVAAILPQAKVISLSRVLSAGNGNVAYTGCGFAPAAIIVTGAISGGASYNTFTGMAAKAGGVGSSGTYATGANSIATANLFYFSDTTGGNIGAATVASWDADGVTLTWTATGTPIGTATAYIACLKG